MRAMNILRNSAYALTSFFITSLFAIAVRKYFTIYLSVELLGLEGLFSDIVRMLSLAELGISSIISYGLYRELANENYEEINTLMNIYRQIYTVIGLFVLIVGIVLFFFLPDIVTNTTISWEYVQFMYVIQIGTILSTYFLAYKRTLLTADQKDYVCIKVDTVCQFMNNICRMAAIVFFQSYMMYAMLGLIFNVLANIIISSRIKKSYPFIHSIKITLDDIRQRRFFTDVKNLIIQKLAGIIYGGADSIFLSSILGLWITGLFANYQLINQGIFAIMYKALQGIVPSIGNLVYEGDLNKNIKIYNMLDFVYLILGGYLAAIYCIFFQPFMELFFGNDFLLPDSMVVLWAVYVFIMVQFENACNFRNTIGQFDKDRNWIVMSAIIKILTGIPAIYVWGVNGLILSSMLGWLAIGYGRLKIVFGIILKGQHIYSYLGRHFLWSCGIGAEIACLYLWVNGSGGYQNYIQLIISGFIVFIAMTLMNIVLFYRIDEFKDTIKYVMEIKKALICKFNK